MSVLLIGGLTAKYFRLQLHQCFKLDLDSTSEVSLLIASTLHTFFALWSPLGVQNGLLLDEN